VESSPTTIGLGGRSTPPSDSVADSPWETSMDGRAGGIRIERPLPGSVVLVLTGEHDLTTKGALDACLGSLVAENELVVADASEALFIDSTTIHALVTADRAARERGSTFRLQLGTAEVVERALALTGLLKRLDCAPTRQAALRRAKVGS
jgi:anti-anti-sigma factor